MRAGAAPPTVRAARTSTEPREAPLEPSVRTTTSPSTTRPAWLDAAPAPAAAAETFWRIVCQLFPPDFTYGAGVLLGTHDHRSSN